MTEQEKKKPMHPDFPQWLETEDGQKCLNWPISEVKYLHNRLFWAFDAGRNCVWDLYMKNKNENDQLREAMKFIIKRLDSGDIWLNEEEWKEFESARKLVEK